MSVKYAILGLLHYKDMHGYRVKELLESNFGNMWTVNYGQIYPALSKMREEGLLTMSEVAQTDAPAKKLYSITPKGKKAFSKWLNSSPEKGLIMRDPFLLRMTFFNFGKKERALDIIAEQIDLYEAQLKLRTENMPKRKQQDVYVHLLADLGVNLNKMMLDWLKRAEKEIAAEEK
jgi:PadR family transcriptional regulator, regulatory protein AphA